MFGRALYLSFLSLKWFENHFVGLTVVVLLFVFTLYLYALEIGHLRVDVERSSDSLLRRLFRDLVSFVFLD